MKNSRGRAAWISWALAGILAFGDMHPVAAEEMPTFGQLISGGNIQDGPEAEGQYTTVAISSEEDLAALAMNCQVDSWSRDKYVTLTEDIVLSSGGSISIPSFGGIFDGGGHTISGLELTGTGSAAGLFRYVQEGGVVRDLSVSGRVSPEGSKSRVGILAGVNYGSIMDCSVSGSVTGAEEVGGIVGLNEGTGEIRRCRSRASVTGDHYTGGICGSNKGILNGCENSGKINTHSTDVSLSIEDITVDGLEDWNSAENVAVHTDTGGIAGYSEGKIYYCVNAGTVGYRHVGYNTGGIVGRLHQGYLQNCTNTGHVLGRKDVGGIAGQMEPFLEIAYLNDKLGELDRETDVFFNLLEAAHGDLSACGKEASALSESISGHLTNASAAAGNLTGTANELWYIYNQELTGINDDLSRLNREWADQATASQGEKDREGNDMLNPTSEVQEDGGATIGENARIAAGPGSADRPGNGSGTDMGTEEAPEGPGAGSDTEDRGDGDGQAPGDEGSIGNGEDAGDNDGQAPGDEGSTGNGEDAGDGDGQVPGDEGSTGNGEDAGDNDGQAPGDEGDTGNGEDAGDGSLLPGKPGNGGTWPDHKVDLESYLAALRRFGEGTSGHLGNITSATDDRSGGISANLQILNQELQAAGNELGQLASVLRQGGDTVSGDVDALLRQAKVLRRIINELRDDLFRYEGITVEDASDEAAGGDPEMMGAETGEAEQAYYDTATFQQGKITLCVNQGIVEADANVGGIAGLIATEYDFDPEDDISLSGEESFRIEQSVKAVVRESRNLGGITGKKDCVGGIVGKADFGAVVSCESYGTVRSTGGSYVGGVAGSSDYCIRSCYAMGILEGESFVGGIVGRGCDVFYSYAYPELRYSGECAGSIAGGLKEEGTLWGNYYVQGNVPGVDSVGYEGGAMPLAYDAFCAMEDVPDAFAEFTVTFLAEGKELASFRCPYGGSIDSALIPQVPEKEGYYGKWPQFDYGCVTGNKELEAIYERWTTSLASREKDEEGRAMVLVQGEFLPGAELELADGPDGSTEISVLLKDGNGEPAGQYRLPISVRVLDASGEDAGVELWTGDGWQQAPCSAMGSYLEFSMEEPGAFRVTVREKDSGWMVPAACAGAAAMILGIILARGSKKHRGRKHK